MEITPEKSYRIEGTLVEAMQELTIRIWPTDQGDGGNGGYMYTIYATDSTDEDKLDDFEIDGGLCTGTLADALGMAQDQAMDIIKRTNLPE